ncbi:MAG: Rrf2 family transcriptional regulator [Pirellulales bacterium]|nr:Rrf2 family transcriptional regulator [Pirellulales bacterium]
MISRTAEYALRAITFLAGQNSQPRTTAQIAEQTQMPIGYLAKVMRSLGRAGLVHSQRGLQGGFVLVADPRSLSIWQVVSAVEPSRRVKECPLGLPDHAQLCPLHARLDYAAELVENAFRQTTIQELLEPDAVNRHTCKFPDRRIDEPCSKEATC